MFATPCSDCIDTSVRRLTISQLKNALHDVGYEVDHELLEVVDQLETDEDNKVKHWHMFILLF